jgi:uncharacterized protein YndB with AHSA1/START domain
VRSEQDFRVGGKWRACLKSASDDRVLWQGGVFHEIVPPERLVFSFKWENDDHEDGAPVDTVVTVLLTELPDGRTLMEFTQTGLKSEQSLSGHSYGWTSTFDRLEQWLRTRE